jgi:peptide/nickel transport system substrate-binding protein
MAFSVAGLGVSRAADETPRGGTVSINESPQGNWSGANFSPFSSQNRNGTLIWIYEPLIVYNPVDGGKPTYWLATDAKYSDDLKSVTFTLRKGVKWSDGQAFSADDLVYTMELIKSNTALDLGGLWAAAGIDKVTKVDDLTVKFDLKEVYTQADVLIGGLRVVPKHIWEKIADPVKELNSKPVGTGPFTEVTDFSESVYTICRNPNYWQEGKPYIDCVRYPAYSGNDAANNAMINGELDWAGNYIPDIQKTFIAKDPEHYGYFFWPAGAAPVLLYFNTTKAPFDDVIFRRALSNAIDRDAIVNNVYGPGYTEGYNPTGIAPIRYKDWMDQASLDEAKKLGVGGFDVEGSKKALEAAGYKLVDGKLNGKDGKPISFKIQTVNGWTDWTGTAQVVAQNFQDLGLDVSIETPEFGAWLTALQTATFDMSMGWANYGNTPWDFYRNQFNSSFLTKGADGAITAQSTLWHRLTSPEIDKLILEFTSTTDLAKQKEVVAKLMNFYVTNVPDIPLMANCQWYEWNTNRFEGFPTEKDYYAQGSPWNQPGALLTGLKLHCKDATSCGQKK